MWETLNTTGPGSISPSLIDTQRVWFNFSAWIVGYANQDNNVEALLTFTDQDNQKVSNITTLEPVLAVDRGSISSLIFRQANGFVPIGARSFTTIVTMNRVS
jgi:hypothetical protein